MNEEEAFDELERAKMRRVQSTFLTAKQRLPTI